ncbi:phospholipid-transporting ATPase ABCA3-like isoform X2 [Dermacentor albipictus]|uniref:phospholipid-transporting ATPase ABCA3-like isoform X2 n=1 Tax=Dermacentor albipictus TaxID=60249 RepID=UPI0038FCB20B
MPPPTFNPTTGIDGPLVGSRSMRAVPLLWCRQLYIILWKNVYVKRISRHYLTTVLEVALMVTLLLGIQEDSVVREPMVRRGDTVFNPIKTDAFWNTQRDVAHIDTVYFAPKSKYLSALTRSAFGALRVSKVIEVPTEQQLIERAREDANYANGTLPATSVLLLYTNHAGANDTVVPVSLHVRMYAGRLPFDLQVLYQQRLISQPEGPVAEERFPEMNTMLPVMAALQQRHLELQAERFGYEHTVKPLKLQRFPFPSYLEYKDTKNYALVLTRFCIGMLIPFSFFVARLSDEKATGMKEMLRVMGLSDWVYWVSHYLSGFFMHLITVTLMMLFVSVKRNEEDRSFIQFSDPLLLFTILMCFCSNCQMHAILISMFFTSSQYAIAGAMLYWTFSCVMPFLTLEQAGGQGYYYIQRKHKLWTSIFPGMSLHWSFRVLERFEKFVPNGANWSNFYDRSATPDNITLAELLFVGLMCDCTIIFLVWYLDNALHVGPGISKPYLFPFQSIYWIPRMSELRAPPKSVDEQVNFEPEPTNQLVAIEIINASKDYDGVVAVQDVSMRVFENQITVLLGHNGAGKTTLLNMITGFLDSSSGVVLVGGYDVKTCTRDARDSIGYCAQYNILIDDLSVEEHLMYFAIIKGVRLEKARSEVRNLLHDVALLDQRATLAVDLSLGQQRRLCTAMAIIATPKVIILDEPTANMDPDGRREMWELLLKVRRSCSIFLTTQHLDEADVLGDRIVIMAHGQIRCGGSPTFLKHRYGAGYHMKINKLHRCNVPAIEELLHKYAPKAKLQSNSDNEAVFILGQIIATRKLVNMFKALENRSAELGIASVGMTVTSLEDVLVRVAEEQHIHRKAHNLGPVASEEPSLVDGKLSVIRIMASATSTEPSALSCVCAVLHKRATYMWREKKMPLFSWMLPPLLLLLLFFLEDVGLRGSGYDVEHEGGHVGYTFPEVIGTAQGFYAVETDKSFTDKWLRPLTSDASEYIMEEEDASTDLTKYLLDIAKDTLRKYVFNMHFGVQTTKRKGNVLWYNGQIQHTAPLVVTLYNMARLRNVTKKAAASLTFELSARGSEELHAAAGSGTGVLEEDIRSQNTYRTLLPKVLRSIFFPLVTSLMCSNFVIFPTAERTLKVKHLHMIAGMGPVLYWLTNYAFDFMFYMGTALIVLLPLPLVPHTTLSTEDFQLIFLLNLLHGYAALPAIYICSFVFDSPIVAYSQLVIFTFIISSGGSLAAVFMEHYGEDLNNALLTTAIEVTLQVLRLLPSQSYSRGMTKILQLARENGLCRRGGLQLESRCHTKQAQGRLSLLQCCLHLHTPDPSEYIIHPLDVSPYSAFYEFLTLSIEGVVLFVLLVCIEVWLPWVDKSLSTPNTSAHRERVDKPSHAVGKALTGTKKPEDTDVTIENKLIGGLVKNPTATPASGPLMVVNRLFKSYGYVESNPVLQGLSFTVHSGECFGLLGVNGVGKTTTFRVLASDILPHDGDALISGFSVVNHTHMYRRYVGYCPQRDGVLDMLTGTETLQLFGHLKGIAVTPQYLHVLLHIFRLQEIAEQLVITFSAGNRRKLSLCVSVMGMPRMLLLDEPYATIAPAARKRIVNYINALQQVSKMSILLSSHSLSDVEFLCNRIAIMGEGRLQCLGSLAHLKEKFGKGYTISVKTYPDKKQDFGYQQDVAEAVCKAFPEAEMVHTCEGLLEFRMSRVQMQWSEMFTRMARIKQRFKLQDFFITDTSLEQIFTSVTRKEAFEAAAAAAAAAAPAATGALPPVLGTTLGL